MTSPDVTARERGAANAFAAAPAAAQPSSTRQDTIGSVGILPSGSAILLASIAFGIVFLLAWQFLPPALGVPPYIIPTVTDLAHEFTRMLARENLLKHILSTVTIAAAGFVIGSLLGAALGYMLGMSVVIEKVLSPYLLGLQIAPKVAFAPLFIMWLGYNAWPKLIVTDPGRILSDPRQRAAVDEDHRPRPDQSGARLQHEPHADLLEG